jgi:hypothetical protein
MQRTVRAVLFFVFAFFSGGAAAEAQQEIALIQGTAHYYALPDVYPGGEVWKSGMTWEVWGNLYYSKTNAYDIRVGGFTPQFRRGGASIQPFTLSYAATEQARGNVSVNGSSNINTYFANINDTPNSAKMTFSRNRLILPTGKPDFSG